MSDLKSCPFCGGKVEAVIRGSNKQLAVFKCEEASTCIGSGLGTYAEADKLETAITAWNRRAAIAAVEAEGWQLVPVDDAAFNLSNTSLPWPMIDAGIKALEQVNEDDLNYEAGVTTCWDMGMVAVAVYRAMLSAAPKPAAPEVE